MRYVFALLALIYLLANLPRVFGADPPKLNAPQQAEWDKAVKAALFAENLRLLTKESYERKAAELMQAENEAKKAALTIAKKLLKDIGAAEGCDLSIDGAVVCPPPKDAKK